MIRARSQKQKAAAIIIVLSLQKKRQKQKRRWWVRPRVERRSTSGAYNTLLKELRIEDPQQFKIFLRMSATDLEEILRVVGPLITKKDTVMRNAIPAKERLAVTLRFLATGKPKLSFILLWRCIFAC